MKNLILLLLNVICVTNIIAQEKDSLSSIACMPIKEFVDSVKWDATESQFVYDFKSNVVPSKHEEWDFENSESNFSIVNICVDSIKVVKSYIRVSKKSKKIHRINLIMISSGENEQTSKNVIETVINDFGSPLKIEEERSRFVDGFKKKYYWSCIVCSSICFIFWNSIIPNFHDC